MNASSDQQLIRQSLDGDDSAFDELVTRYQDRLVHSLEFALGSRDDALEAAQQAFISAWRRLATFRHEAEFYSWLYRIAMNAAISRRRKQRIETTSLESLEEASGASPADPNPAADPAHPMSSEERVRIVRQALQEVAEEFRQPLIMKEMDGFSYEQIASILEIPLGTVRSRIFRARQELTERLKRVLGDDR
ncbi:MAG: sigma-70 family RNA polymerase sigma factor [Planctomycetaceae bacterium]